VVILDPTAPAPAYDGLLAGGYARGMPMHTEPGRRGRQIAKVAIARKILTLCFYGLRDGEIRALKAPGPADAMKVMAPT
jgi:hypothetical protein